MPATITAPSDASSVESSDDAFLLNIIQLVFRIHGYPPVLPFDDVAFEFALIAPEEYQEALMDVVEFGIEGVDFYYDEMSGLPYMALDDPLPPSQLHRLYKAIVSLSMGCFCRVEGTEVSCINSDDVNDILRKTYNLDETIVSAWDELDNHPLIDYFYVDEDKYYSLTTEDFAVIFDYLLKADAAAGASFDRLVSRKKGDLDEEDGEEGDGEEGDDGEGDDDIDAAMDE